MVYGVTRHLPLSALRAFESVTRTGSFRAAATDLSLTPSAVSHAIRGLEQTLGAALFIRDGRSIRLTAEGERLMHYVERGFSELQLGIISTSMRGPRLLRLHCAPSIAAQWLVPRLRRLLAETNGLEMRIVADTNYTRFVDDDFDADIVYGAPSPHLYGRSGHQGVVMVPLGTETVVPLCAPDVAKRIRSARSLLSETLILSEVKKVRWTEWFAANDMLAPDSYGLRFDRSFLSLSAAADGAGVALESTLLAERELASGRLVRPLRGICKDVAYTGHWLVFPHAKRYSQSIVTFIIWLMKELALEVDFGSIGSGTGGLMPTPSRRVSRPQRK
jgi:LysR family transcriptional regulator, glycine cleavage system transcriptional activator